MTTCPFCDSKETRRLTADWVRCASCGLAFPETPMPPRDLSLSDEDRPAVWMDSQETIYRRSLDTIERKLGRKGRLLDIGCGHGFFMKLALSRGWQAEGIEVSAPAVRQARDVFKLTVYDKPLEFLGLAPESYDLVTLWRVLDLLPEPRKELERINRVMKPGGLVWLRVNNFSFHYPAFRLGETALCRKFNIKPGVIHRFGIHSRSLKTVLSRTGFEAIRMQNSPLTSGDPYGSGGKPGALLVIPVKKLMYGIWQFLAFATFGKLLLASSLIARARKPERS